MTNEQLSIFVTKATKQYLIEGRNQVEGMTVALAALFKGEVLTEYMEENAALIEKLDAAVGDKVPTRSKEKQSKSVKKSRNQSRVDRSMQNLGQLTSLFQGTWNPSE